MSEFKGTKGKWEVVKDNFDINGTFAEWLDVVSEEGNVIAEVKGVHYNIPNEECRSNTMIISKAPEMLELLYKVQAMCDKLIFPTELELKRMNEKCKKLIKEATEL